MPISDPRERFFYPHHTPMIDTYILCHGCLKELDTEIAGAAEPHYNITMNPLYKDILYEPQNLLLHQFGLHKNQRIVYFSSDSPSYSLGKHTFWNAIHIIRVVNWAYSYKCGQYRPTSPIQAKIG